MDVKPINLAAAADGASGKLQQEPAPATSQPSPSDASAQVDPSLSALARRPSRPSSPADRSDTEIAEMHLSLIHI